jgi:hypothetical protein
MRNGNRNLKANQVSEASATQYISPTLEPESSKKFFKKDYPRDTRPAVDVLHFQHPYPVVQDSEDYDKDFVKDENSDDGEWHAQEEYDRLRHKLAKEKKDADKALTGKERAEKELKELMDEYHRDMEKANAAIAEKQAAKDQAEKSMKKDETPEESRGWWSWSWNWNWWPWKWPSSSSAPPVQEARSDGVAEATAETTKKMSELEECQKELAATRERLKKLMEELEQARSRQGEAKSALEEARRKELDADKEHGRLEDELAKEKADHDTVEAAYLKQKAIVEAMEKDLLAAAAKVKQHRDSEDPDGGVYNVVKEKSSGPQAACVSGVLWLFALCSQVS